MTDTEDILSLCASSSFTDAQMSDDGNDTDEDVEWVVLDEYNDDGNEIQDKREVEFRDVEEKREVKFKEIEEKREVKSKAVETRPEEIEMMGVKVTFYPEDEQKKIVEVAHLTSDLRSKSVYHKPVRPPSDDNEPKFNITLPPANKLPRGITSYERIPKELLPQGMKFCPICSIAKKSHIKRHILRTHVPWFWAATLACWQCEQQTCQQSSIIHHNHTKEHHDNNAEFLDEENLHRWCLLMNGAMFLLVKWLELNNLDDLFSYIQSRMIRARGVFSTNEIRCMTFYCQHYSNTVPTNFSIDPPNHIICIFHFEIIVRLLQKIRTEKRLQEFVNSKLYLTTEGLEVITTNTLDSSNSYEFIDSHFHLDALIKRLSSSTHYRGNFENVENMLAKMHTHKLMTGIANYVYPNNWQLWSDQVGKSRIKVSFGIHPHMAAYGTPNYRWRELNKLIQNPKCVAVGETGIDSTTNCDCLATLDHCYTPEECKQRIQAFQEESLIVHLQLAAQFNKPVILHCRDNGDGTSAARVLEIIRQHQFTNLPFHRHCFLGSLSEFEEWNLLPRITFGICVGNSRNESLEIVIPKIPETKFVLETDSPYLPPSRVRINHPWNLVQTAEFVARLRNVPISFIFEMSNTNCRNLYKL